MSSELTQTQKDALHSAFERLKSYKRPEEPGHLTGREDAIDFCGDWPRAKAVLLFLENIPGIPDILKTALRDAVYVGDVTFNTICPA